MAKKISFGLEMKDGVPPVRDLEDLRKNFDIEKAMGHFRSGRLVEWLENRFCDEEAEKIEAIDKNAPSDVIQRQLYEALGVEPPEKIEDDFDMEIVQRNNDKKDILRQKTSDETIIAHAAQTAFNQGDLADLWNMKEPTIYLCGVSFKIRSRITARTYIGVLCTPKIEIDANSREELAEKGIKFENVELPEHLRETPTRVCPKCGEKVRNKAKFCDNCGASMEEKPVAEEKHIETVTASAKRKSLPKEKLQALYKTNFKGAISSDIYSQNRAESLSIEDVWGIDRPSEGLTGRRIEKGNLNASEKEGLLLTIGQGQYKEEDLIHIRVAEDLSCGWALTTDSVCFAGNWGSEIIPYSEVDNISSWESMSTEKQNEMIRTYHSEGPFWVFKCKNDKQITIDMGNKGIGKVIGYWSSSCKIADALKRYLIAAKNMCNPAFATDEACQQAVQQSPKTIDYVVSSPIRGIIKSVQIAVGETIRVEQLLFEIYAMKMMNEIVADCDGTVKEIKVSSGQTVSSGETLAIISKPVE